MVDKNKYGQYFTADALADFMVSLITQSNRKRVLEPSCGQGVFLKYLMNAGFTNISAYEIDPELKSEYEFVQYRSFLSVPLEEKYDVVIGNPPYIRWKNLEPELKRELKDNKLWCKYFNSLCDYLFIFILKSIEHLKENGELIFICTEYWLNTTHSASLRKYMCRHGYFSEIYHFKETSLFEGVTASFIIFKYIRNSSHHAPDIRLYQYTGGAARPSLSELEHRSCFNCINIPQFQENSRWLLATKAEQEELNQFEFACLKDTSGTMPYCSEPKRYQLADFCEIGNGMVSGLDAVFQISEQELAGLNAAERNHIIPVVKARSLMPYQHQGITSYIFLQESICDSEFEAQYPNFARHFKPYQEKLAQRYSYHREIPYWEFVFPRNQKLFARKEPRIFVPSKERISARQYFRFCYAAPECYATQDVTAIFKKEDTRESVEYILAFLNNRRVFDWLRFNGIVKGAIVEFSERPLASIPFRPINWRSAPERALHDQITYEVRQYLQDGHPVHLKQINLRFDELYA